MARSGNPAKAAVQRSLEEAKAGVRQGKTIRLHPFPNTQVIIKSSNPEEAAEVIEALQPAEEPGELTAAGLSDFLWSTSLALVMFGDGDKFENMIRRWLAEESQKWNDACD